MTKLTRPTVDPVSREGDTDGTVACGQWYWVKRSKKEGGPWLGCVTEIGSNYAELTMAGREWNSTQRVHFDHFSELCTPELNADAYIRQQIDEQRQLAASLMNDVRQIVGDLALAPRAIEGGETAALVRVSDARPIDDYKTALVKAEKTTLPKLFKKIGDAHKAMGVWMQAPMIPLQAQAEAMQPVLTSIKNRIFSVQLYAGLREDVVQVRDGAPASRETPIHLFQRRAYMDEECLFAYKAGGMDYRRIEDFDAWMAGPANFERLLPFPRCVLAFQVRRFEKEREAHSIADFITVAMERDADKKTFLYLRNGDQLFRLATAVEFGASLFPDLDAQQLTGELYVELHDKKIITAGHYDSLVEELRVANEAADAKFAAEQARGDKNVWRDHVHDPTRDYFKWNKDSVYYDDAAALIQSEIERHNRLALVLQGLLDRSMVFQPHPGWQLFTPEGFTEGLRLIYDNDRALVGGDKPDFEAFRAKLNATITKTSTLVGQQRYWMAAEAVKENARQAADYRIKNPSNYRLYSPYGNDGPGEPRTPTRVTKSACEFKWFIERRRHNRWGPNDDLPRSVLVPKTALLHVDAYQPGDFKQFFADPRTRMEYLQWAPLLLAAEDWHAGITKARKVPGNVRDYD